MKIKIRFNQQKQLFLTINNKTIKKVKYKIIQIYPKDIFHHLYHQEIRIKQHALAINQWETKIEDADNNN